MKGIHCIHQSSLVKLCMLLLLLLLNTGHIPCISFVQALSMYINVFLYDSDKDSDTSKTSNLTRQCYSNQHTSLRGGGVKAGH